jgi:hypothetical protein
MFGQRLPGKNRAGGETIVERQRRGMLYSMPRR